MNFDLTKPVQTRDGRPARIVSTNMAGRYPILAIIDEGEAGDLVVRYTANGEEFHFPGESDRDLVNVPDTVEEVVYVNLGDVYSNEAPARLRNVDNFGPWPVVKLTLRVGHKNGVEDTREVLSAELVDADD